jgi:hypothetical protein
MSFDVSKYFAAYCRKHFPDADPGEVTHPSEAEYEARVNELLSEVRLAAFELDLPQKDVLTFINGFWPDVLTSVIGMNCCSLALRWSGLLRLPFNLWALSNADPNVPYLRREGLMLLSKRHEYIFRTGKICRSGLFQGRLPVWVEVAQGANKVRITDDQMQFYDCVATEGVSSDDMILYGIAELTMLEFRGNDFHHQFVAQGYDFADSGCGTLP